MVYTLAHATPVNVNYTPPVGDGFRNGHIMQFWLIRSNGQCEESGMQRGV